MKSPLFYIRKKPNARRGSVIVLVAVCMFLFVGLAALSIDVHHLWMVSNELQNSADAGALAGASVLYGDSGGTTVNEGTNLVAFNAARQNAAISEAGSIAVDVNWPGGSANTGDVMRGHWSFTQYDCDKDPTSSCTSTCNDPLISKGCFFANSSTAQVSLEGRSAADLDVDPDFINAVRVVARRDATRASSFFARIFGYENFALSTQAVGYIGFAGTLNPNEVDQPIAICKQMITDNSGNYSCNTGRMLNSSGGTTSNTAAWTNFTQPCETATPTTMRPLICGSGNPNPIAYGNGIGTVNGVQDNIYRDLLTCWKNAPIAKDWREYPREKWTLTLPVIDCPSPAISNCADAVGAVTVDVVWVKEANADPDWLDIPVQMEDWTCSVWNSSITNLRTGMTLDQRKQCWSEFAQHFNLKTWDNTSIGTLSASNIQKTLVFLPNCEPHEPAGVTGGENYGVLAKTPVLVK